jgi:hypothetical protein
MEWDKKLFVERVEKARRLNKLQKRDLSSPFSQGSPHMISGWLSMQRPLLGPSLWQTAILSELLKVSPGWLAFGDCPMNAKEQEIVGLIRALSDDQKARVPEIIKAAFSPVNEQPDHSHTPQQIHTQTTNQGKKDDVAESQQSEQQKIDVAAQLEALAKARKAVLIVEASAPYDSSEQHACEAAVSSLDLAIALAKGLQPAGSETQGQRSAPAPVHAQNGQSLEICQQAASISLSSPEKR